MLSNFDKIPVLFAGACLLNLGLSTSAQAASVHLGESSLTPVESVAPVVPALDVQNPAIATSMCDDFSGNIAQFVPAEPEILASRQSTLVAQAGSDLALPVIDSDDALASCLLASAGGGAALSSVGGFPLSSSLASSGLLSLVPLTTDGSSSPASAATSASPAGGALIASNSASPANAIAVTFSKPSLSAVAPTQLASITSGNVESVPEPMTIFGTGLALGAGAFLERKRSKKSLKK